MTTLNEHSLTHNLNNDLIHFSESDKDPKETGNNDFLSDIDPDIGYIPFKITNVPIIILRSLIRILLSRITFLYWL